MNVPKKEKPYSAMLLIKSSRNKGKDFIKKNQKMITNKEVDDLLEI